jgi:hypothetical protein
LIDPSAKAASSSTRTAAHAPNLAGKRAVENRHLQIEHDHVDRLTLQCRQQSRTIGDHGDHLHVRVICQQATQSFQHQLVIVGERDAQAFIHRRAPPR